MSIAAPADPMPNAKSPAGSPSSGDAWRHGPTISCVPPRAASLPPVVVIPVKLASEPPTKQSNQPAVLRLGTSIDGHASRGESARQYASRSGCSIQVR